MLNDLSYSVSVKCSPRIVIFDRIGNSNKAFIRFLEQIFLELEMVTIISKRQNKIMYPPHGYILAMWYSVSILSMPGQLHVPSIFLTNKFKSYLTKKCCVSLVGQYPTQNKPNFFLCRMTHIIFHHLQYLHTNSLIDIIISYGITSFIL